MTKNKLIFFVAAFSLLSSAVIYADDSGMTPYGKNATYYKKHCPTSDEKTTTETKATKGTMKKHKKHAAKSDCSADTTDTNSSDTSTN